MAFVFTITTPSPSTVFTIPCQNVGVFNATVDWGDGGATSAITTYNDADLAHTYTTAGDYTVTITGTFPNIYFNNSGTSRGMVTSVVDLGDVGWVRLRRAFYGCSSLVSFGSATGNTSSVDNFSTMFRSCSAMATCDVSGFDTSFSANTDNMFRGCSTLTTLDVSGWDISGVTTTAFMFRDCSTLTTLDVSGWDTSGVSNLDFMFEGCTTLTGLEISGWDISSVTTAKSFLSGANNTLSTAEYNATLEAWGAQTVQAGVSIHFGDATYTGPAVSIQLSGLITYADNNSEDEAAFCNWEVDANNYIRLNLSTGGTLPASTGNIDFSQRSASVTDRTASPVDGITPSVNVPFNIASYHTMTSINGSLNGTAGSADLTPTTLCDLSTADFLIAPTFTGFINQVVVWPTDIADAGIEEATS
jgi:surface protein